MINLWLLYSLISICFASLMQVLLKKCLSNVDPYVSTIYRNLFIFLISFSILFINDTKSKIFNISKKDLFILIIISICAFLAYLFYFLAMKNGDIKNVVAIDKLSIVLVLILSLFFFKEKISFYDIIGTILLLIGSFIIVYK